MSREVQVFSGLAAASGEFRPGHCSRVGTRRPGGRASRGHSHCTFYSARVDSSTVWKAKGIWRIRTFALIATLAWAAAAEAVHEDAKVPLLAQPSAPAR